MEKSKFMKKRLGRFVHRIIIGLFVFFALAFYSACTTYSGPLTLERQVLERNKSLLHQGNSDLAQALSSLKKQADSILGIPNRSVTEKTKTPPSGDKRDYLSIGQYWWPDPSQPDGLPYIRKDGKTNPEFYKITDNTYIRQMANNVKTLAVAYYFTGDENYASKAISQIDTWFLDPKTKMNPNLNYAQYIPGVNEGRSEGIIDTRVLVDVLDGVTLLESSSNWNSQLDQNLKSWFRQYLDWLQTSENGIGGSKLVNNIGSAYYMQIIAFATYAGNITLAKQVIQQKLPKLIDHQFDVDGKQPEELSRTNAWGYSIANLGYWFRIAQLAQNIGIDLWNYQLPSGKSIRQAYMWLMPYAERQKKWTYQQLKESDFEETFAPLRARGARKFSENTSQTLRKVSKRAENTNNNIEREQIRGQNQVSNQEIARRQPILLLTEEQF